MSNRRRPSAAYRVPAVAIAAIVIAGGLLLATRRPHPPGPRPSPAAALTAADRPAATGAAGAVPGAVPAVALAGLFGPGWHGWHRWGDWLARLRDRTDPCRPGELVFAFASPEAYAAFLRAADRVGLRLDRLDALRVARLRFESAEELAAVLPATPDGLAALEWNPILFLPAPTAAARAAAAASNIPFGDRLMEFLGVAGPSPTWGEGVSIAVLDGGVGPDPTFGEGRLRALDIGRGLAPAASGHGTAMAALAAGAAADAAGIAPAAGIISIRVTDDGGRSDAFTVSRGIMAAVDAGAAIVNISMGGYGSSAALAAAVDYAAARGVAIIASAGNDQADRLTWPAAEPGVVAVGAVDGGGGRVTFSNRGDGLDLMAPGYGLPTAWSDGKRAWLSGTSASAAIVSGATAALLSANPGMTPAAAVAVLTRYASDSGPPGDDPEYGRGTLNLGWAFNRNDPGRVDTAIAGQTLDRNTGDLEVVVQNRSGKAVAGLTLAVAVGGGTAPAVYPVPPLAAGQTAVVRGRVALGVEALSGPLPVAVELRNPPGLTDAVGWNNIVRRELP